MVRKRLPVWPRVLLAAVLLAVMAAGCSAPRSVLAAEPQKAAQEGIKVHGRWTIEVRNPDGTMVERREFDNALSSTASPRLVSFLARQKSVGGWRVTLSGSPQAFLDAGGGASQGILTESTDTASWPYFFKTLTVSVGTAAPNTDKLVLSGTAVAQQAGTISSVQTSVALLDPTSPPASSYPTGTVGSITGTTLASSVSLSTGQQVAVTVVISFS